jgi:hypothetical protein
MRRLGLRMMLIVILSFFLAALSAVLELASPTFGLPLSAASLLTVAYGFTKYKKEGWFAFAAVPVALFSPFSLFALIYACGHGPCL